MSHSDTILTILIPTYKRYCLLVDCVKSVRTVYKNVQIVIGDSNSTADQIHQPNLADYEHLKILDLSKYENDIYHIYRTLIESVKTPYVLIVEDDDLLINEDTHKKCYDDLMQLNIGVLTFSGSTLINNHIEQYLVNSFDFNNLTQPNIPEFWNGNFLLGLAYFKTSLLLECFDEWIANNIERTFDGSIDESITLLAIYKSNSYRHINKNGLYIGIQNDNISWNNVMLSMYSSCNYIDELRWSLHETYKWQENYKKILLKELLTMCPSIRYADVFLNRFFLNLKHRVKTLLLEKTAKYVKNYLAELLLMYLNLKLYNLQLNSYVKTNKNLACI